MNISDITKVVKTYDELTAIQDHLFHANRAKPCTPTTFGIEPFEIDVNGQDITSLIPFESLKKLVVDSLNQAVNERLLILKSMGIEINEPETSKKELEINVNQTQEDNAPKPVDSEQRRWGDGPSDGSPKPWNVGTYNSDDDGA